VGVGVDEKDPHAQRVVSPQDARRTQRTLCAMDHAYVYLLRCRDGSLYSGWTVDLDRRLAAHASVRGSAYVARRLPARFAAAWRAESRTHARSAEARIKRLTRAEKLARAGGGPLPDELGPLRPHPL
jgi:putative endonuclease